MFKFSIYDEDTPGLQNKIGFNEPLVDEEGFPLPDIDVRSVRIARTQIICLQNDLKQLTLSIEEGLEKYFVENKDKVQIIPVATSSSQDEVMRTSTSSSAAADQQLRPFVVVNLVSPESPAESAGIEVRDQILSFGSVTSSNFRDLAQIGELVKNSVNQEIKVKVKRDNKIEELILVPKAWSGRGLLGCNIVPTPTQ